MSFKQLVELSINKEKPDLTLITVLTEADFRGYSSEADNLNMSLYLFRDIESFPKFCKQQEFSLSSMRLFNFNLCKCLQLKFDAPKLSVNA